jgi:hypothetical protein
MVDDTTSAVESADRTCPWCSATYTGDPEMCPSCGAALSLDPATDASLPGLTAIDAAAIVRAKTPVARPRNRFLSWISGDYPDDQPSVTEAGALAPPDTAVRREMLRLELEAEVANLQAEADALMAEAGLEGPQAAATTDAEAAAADTSASGATEPDVATIDAASGPTPTDSDSPPPAA